MSKYRDLTKEELEIINQSNYFSELVLQGLGKILQSIVRTLVGIFILSIALIIIAFISGPSFFSRYHLLKNFDPIIASYWAIVIMIYIGGILFILTLVLVFFSDHLIKKLNKAVQKNKEYKYFTGSFEEILKNTYSIYSIIKILFFIRKTFKFFREKSVMTKLDEFLKIYIDNLYDFLSNLRSDLQFRLKEQQKTLESAKSEVENNIHGTTEIESISELQIARLDKQIEQFEELEKILIKV